MSPVGVLRNVDDSQGETNSIVKVKKQNCNFASKLMMLCLCVAWDCKRETSKLQSEVSPMGWMYFPGPFPCWGSRLRRGFSVLLKSGYG